MLLALAAAATQAAVRATQVAASCWGIDLSGCCINTRCPSTSRWCSNKKKLANTCYCSYVEITHGVLPKAGMLQRTLLLLLPLRLPRRLLLPLQKA